MRLKILHEGQRLRARFAIRLIGLTSRTKPDDIARIILYRPGFFGRRYLRLMRAVMRGDSEWTPGEREALAASVSQLNQCEFCAGIHCHVASLASGQTLNPEDIGGWSKIAANPALRAAITLVEKSISSEGNLSREDIAGAKDAGLSREAIYDALHVAFMFNVINRLADTFGATFEGDEGRRRTAAGLYRMGYKVPSFFLN
jgi:uncharacterized peroxidase-related enzyme